MFKRTAVIFGLVALINYFPIVYGKIPFPRDFVLRHSAWNGQPQEQLPELIDIVAMFYPFRALLGRAAEERTLPLWNPHILGGEPFLANAQSALFYPIHLLLLIQRPATFWTVNLLLNLTLSGAFTALFVRSIGGSRAGSIVRGCQMAFSEPWRSTRRLKLMPRAWPTATDACAGANLAFAAFTDAAIASGSAAR